MTTLAAKGLEAGQEMDALIAERVFEREHLRGEALPKFYRHRDVPLEEQEAWVIGEDSWWCASCGTLPSFSTDIAAAWEVVEAMEARGWRVFMTNESGQWNVGFARQDRGGEPAFAHHVTAPLAICLAAISAVTPEPAGDS